MPGHLARAVHRLVLRPRGTGPLRRTEVPRRMAEPCRGDPHRAASGCQRRTLEPQSLRDLDPGRTVESGRPALAVFPRPWLRAEEPWPASGAESGELRR